MIISEYRCTDPLKGWTKLVNQFSPLNLGYYGKATPQVFCKAEASIHPGSRSAFQNNTKMFEMKPFTRVLSVVLLFIFISCSSLKKKKYDSQMISAEDTT